MTRVQCFASVLWFLCFVRTEAFLRPPMYQKVSRLSPNFATSLGTSTSQTRPKTTQDGLSRGDARGAAVLLDGVSIARGSSQILEDIDWRVEPRSKWAVIGTNGAGKSTLLKAMMEELPYDGRITIGTTQTVGYLQQSAVSGSTLTVFEEACSAMTEIMQAKEALQRAENHVASVEMPSENDLMLLDRAVENFERVGGYSQEEEVSSMLKGLGFQDLDQPCSELSGGWKMRVSFAKTLLSKPSLCILDEPGNHLDRNARQWLAQYLKNYEDGAMILVTHDTELLNAMDSIAEVNPGGKGLSIYKSCTYAQYLDLKRERQESAENEYERNAGKAAKLQSFVDKFGASATKASAAQSRVKQLEKMREQGLLEAPTVQQSFRPRLNLPYPPSASNEILMELKDACLGYEQNSPLVTNVNLQIRRGMKILIRGPNGAGKTTLLQSLRGEVPLLAGERSENKQLRLGVFTQDLAQELDPNERAVDLVTQNVRDFDIGISDESARAALGGLGLTGEKALRRLRDLSGGEKARVALAMFALKPSNMYLLDEVSNHLDIECVEALSESLSGWGDDLGTVVVISHDKAFCEKIGFTHVVTVDNGSLTIEQREVTDKDWDASSFTLQRASTQAAKASRKQSELDSATRKKLFNAPKRISQIELLIERMEAKLASLDEAMLDIKNASDAAKLMGLARERELIAEDIAKLMEEWDELEDFVKHLS